MKLFNSLSYFIKEAMGARAYQKREQYDWWNIEELSRGSAALTESQEKWNELAQIDVNLNDVLVEARVRRHNQIRKLVDDFHVPRDIATRSIKTFIGYEPQYGAYIVSVGPYIGRKFEDAEGESRFGYFVLRKSKLDEDKINGMIATKIKLYMNKFGVQLEPGDLQFARKAYDELDPNRENQSTAVRELIVSLDPNNPDRRDLQQRAPMFSSGSIGPNARGMEKILRARWGALYDRVIDQTAASMNISREEVINREITDIGFLESLYLRVKRSYEEAVERGDAVINGMTAPPVFSEVSKLGAAGQINFTQLDTNKWQRRQLELQKAVLRIVREGIEDPAQIVERLGRGGNSPLDAGEVEHILARFNQMRQSVPGQVLDNQQLMDAMDEEIRVTTRNSSGEEGEGKKLGYKDLLTAFEMCRLYLTAKVIDPFTKAKLESKTERTPIDISSVQNMTEDQLRAYKTSTDVPVEEEVMEGEDINIPGEQAVKTEEPLSTDLTPSVPETVETPEEKKKKEEETSPFDMLSEEDLLASTISKLIKIAAEMDFDGKDKEAEEIHKVIRKYQGRCKHD